MIYDHLTIILKLLVLKSNKADPVRLTRFPHLGSELNERLLKRK
jgi:hypothetical protein